MKGICFAVALVAASPAFAQTYVAAAISGDLSKSFESSQNGTRVDEGDREALGWALRVGTAFGQRWGVELEFHRSGELDMRSGPIIFAQDPRVLSAWSSAGLGEITSLFPALGFEIEQRTTAWNASAWIRQALSGRADLVVVAGIGFSRVVQESEFSFGNVLALPPPGSLIRPVSTETIAYGVGPLVGAEGRIRMTDHLELTPGIRAQSLGNTLAAGLLLRPSVALGWTF